jgi:hypothetical protein
MSVQWGVACGAIALGVAWISKPVICGYMKRTMLIANDVIAEDDIVIIELVAAQREDSSSGTSVAGGSSERRDERFKNEPATSSHSRCRCTAYRAGVSVDFDASPPKNDTVGWCISPHENQLPVCRRTK